VIRVESHATVDRPVEDVARYLADIEHMTDMTASRQLSEGPLKEGSRAYAEVAMGPVKLGWTWQVTDMDPNGGYGFKTVSKSALGMDGRVKLTPEGTSATGVDYLVEIHTHGALRLLEPLLRGEMSKNEAAEVTRLKALIEASAPTAAGSPVSATPA
jgi:uncharacterized membrane protein